MKHPNVTVKLTHKLNSFPVEAPVSATFGDLKVCHSIVRILEVHQYFIFCQDALAATDLSQVRWCCLLSSLWPLVRRRTMG